MNKFILEKLVKSVGIYYSISNNLGYSYNNLPSDFNKNEMLVKYKDRYYDRKIGFVDIMNVRYEIVVFNDVTDIKKQSMYDQKTGALTLDTFRKKIEKDIPDDNIVLCLMDIDDFKAINDTFGHHVGDLVLSRVVNSFSYNLGPNDLICRFGGDEFLIAISGKSVDEVREMMDSYANDVRTNLLSDDNICINITFSIGITNYNSEDNFDINFDKVDDAMYYCKKHGKDGVVSREVYVKCLGQKKYSN